ncbi:MAG TPA: FAD-binding oxidoreductase [Longimicrobium sp.]|nr:FAD-binding oxidoreductase [Longimicrobium sp.]
MDPTAPASQAFGAALAAWRTAIGPEWVSDAAEALEGASRATFATTARVRAVLQPGDQDQVAACLGIAHRLGVPVYPVSAGRNWGYGSRVPPRDGSALLSLARLDRVVNVHEELACVTVEPGVTFARLAEFLRARGSRLLPPLTGASPGASVVGNALERGLGKGPYADLAARVCACEAVLPNGQVVRTGFAGLPGAPAAPPRADGPGPSLQGLFAQGSLGVVTRMTLWLDPAPAWRQRVVFLLRGEPELAAGIDALRGLLQRRPSGVQVELMNDYRFLAQTRQFPYGEVDAAAPLPRPWVQSALPWAGGAQWVGCATLWGESKDELALGRRALEERLAPAAGGLNCEEPTPGWEAPESHDGIRSAYWRKRAPMPADPDPDRDGCGVVWLTPVLPMLGAAAAGALAAVEHEMQAHGFEPTLALRPGPRGLQAVVALLYDRQDPGADARAARCHAALRGLLDGRGLYPYRLGLMDLDTPPARDPGSAALLAALKAWADPQGVLAPGRDLLD